jgi:hypothetical protein
MRIVEKHCVAVKATDENVMEDSCPAWHLVEPDKQARKERARLSRAMMAVEGSHEVERLVDTSDFDTLYAELRQIALDALATWQAYFLARSDRIQRHLEPVGVNDATLTDAVNEGNNILRFLAAVGRLR